VDAILIDALRFRAAKDALGEVRRCVSHPDPSTRRAALAYLWDHGGPAETDVLLPRLDQETDAELLETVIDTLSALGCVAAAPALRVLSHDHRRAPELRRAAMTAAGELEMALSAP
jgi:hypothetical protein